ncbi:Tigger transposable element-derived protein 1 [Dictyocoela muelleri]|nr:Tigger transposable element-derived protein 1 [Dictyocoela muelleri]
MTAIEFSKCIEDLNRSFRIQNRKILMFLYNFSGHKLSCAYSNIDICFLHKNSTSKLQPLDASVIKNIQAKYFHYQMSNIVSKMSAGVNVEIIYKQFSLKNAIVYISYAWNDVTFETSKIVGIEQEYIKILQVTKFNML